MEGSGSVSVQIITDLDNRAQKHTDPTDTDPTDTDPRDPEHSLMVHKHEIILNFFLT
jgi:hypothetical protein